MSLQLIITDAGLSAIAQAGTLGPVVISKIAIGSGTWASPPPTSTTALITEIKKITPQGSSTPAPGLIHITAEDSSEDAYSVKEIGLFDSNNVLFAIAGGSTTFLTKYSVSTALISVDISLANVPLGTVTIGNANFTNPPATETTMGVAEIATTAEVNAGVDDSRIVTPAKMKAYTDGLATKTYVRFGSGTVGIGAEAVVYETPTVTVPAGETWVYEFQMMAVSGYTNGNTRATYGTPVFRVYRGGMLGTKLTEQLASQSPYGASQSTFVYSVTAVSGTKLTMTAQDGWGIQIPCYVIKLHKTKTSALSDYNSVI